MLIAYEPNSDVLTVTVASSPVVQSQLQGAASVGYNSLGDVVSVTVANASTVLFENGGQVQVELPPVETVVVTETVVENRL